MGQTTDIAIDNAELPSKDRLKVFLSIDSDPFVPDALSHQQLSALLRAAMDPSAVPEGKLSDDELLRAALSA